ncbi:hypothetical protein AV530_003243 [Patagioenas fasciata monilis]|uniref:Uncharacterized protein n=1 Tax=Patagioenas fasciata monilis TaxID=372326 RepID=A0A1V4KWB4_PATFA|nr:hypothetical protein AV530_003243 [Patagioenas fasciata monilis]
MDDFLKKILEPSEQATFDYLTRVEAPSANRSRCADCTLPSANLGLPRHLIQRHPPRPAYVTHTSDVVKMLVKQNEQRKAASHCPAEMEPNSKPQEAGFEEENQGILRISSCWWTGSKGCLLIQCRWGPGRVKTHRDAAWSMEKMPRPRSVCPGREVNVSCGKNEVGRRDLLKSLPLSPRR